MNQHTFSLGKRVAIFFLTAGLAGRVSMHQTMRLAPGARETLRLELAPEPRADVPPAAAAGRRPVAVGVGGHAASTRARSAARRPR